MKQRSQAKQYRQTQRQLTEYIDVDGFRLVGENRRPRILVSALAARNVKAALGRPLVRELIAPEDIISVADGTRQILTDRAAVVAFDGLCNAVNAVKAVKETHASQESPALSALVRQRDALGHLVVRNGVETPLLDGLSELARAHAEFLDTVNPQGSTEAEMKAPVQLSGSAV